MFIDSKNSNFRWIDNKNSIELTKSWFAKKLMFPLNFYYPGHYEAQAKKLITALYGSLEEDLQDIELQVCILFYFL